MAQKNSEDAHGARLKRLERLLKRANEHKTEHEEMQEALGAEFGANYYEAGQLIGINSSSVRNSLKMKNLKPETMVQWLEAAVSSLKS